MTQRINTVVITGSIKRPSYSIGLSSTIARSLERLGHDVTVFDQRLLPLPICDAVWHHEPESHPDPNVHHLVGLADRADAIVLCSPIYHNGPSGVLKNALDLLVIRHFAYKPVGLISHGGGRSSQAVDQMRIWTRGLLGNAIATQVCTQASDFNEPVATHDPEVIDRGIKARINRFCDELHMFAQNSITIRHALTA